MGDKTEKLFYKIGEVCEMTDTQPYVLRFWESEFPQLAPKKSRSGQRVYRKRDIDIVERIKHLLYDQGFTIAGARKRLEQEDAGAVEPETMVAGAAPVVAEEPAKKSPPAVESKRARTVVAGLKEILQLMEGADRKHGPSGDDVP